MTKRHPLGLFAVPVLAFTASCLLDTTPLAGVPEKGDAQPAEMLPAQDMTGSAALDAAVTTPPEDAATDAGVVLVTPPPSTAPTATIDAGVAPPRAASMTVAKGATAPAAQCNAVSSYGLHAAIDVTWDATPWFDVGSGSVELYGLVQVDAVDSQTHKASASFRVCGMDLPTLNSRALCSSYQLQFPQGAWDNGKLPTQTLEGTYNCDAGQCSLQFSPLSYALGIQLADPNGPWPAFNDTTPAQFSDADADGFAGVSVDVISVASLSSGETGCSTSGGATTSRGPGSNNSNQGNGKKNGANMPTAPSTMPASIGRLLLGMRTQLSAAMQLAPDCQLRDTTASNATLDMRSAGCFVSAGSDPASAASSCSEQLRASFDQTLPHYQAVDSSSGPGAKNPGPAPVLKAIRFAPGTQVSCEQVRNGMF